MAIFELFLKKNSREMDKHLATYFSDGAHPDMTKYLYGPLAEYSANAGKRHRPLICQLACEAVGGDPRKAQRSAAAIEHFHTAALIHDDIEDGALTRRGEPALHIKEGDAIAINAGDLALSLVTGSVVSDDQLDDAVKLRVLRELIDMTTRTIEGQALDIGWGRDNRFDLGIEDYLLMARHKTGFYSGAIPLAVGAIIGGAEENIIEVMRSYGMAAGLAFQIQDDLINLIGDDRSKDYRIDITEGKRTLCVIHALKESPKAARLLEILEMHTDDVALKAEAVEIMRSAGSIDYANNYATGIVLEAKKGLDEVLPASGAKKILLSMADFFVKRSH